MTDESNAGGPQYDPYVSLCPECRQTDVGVADGRSRTYYCPNCDGYMGWSRVIRVRRSEVADLV